MDVACAAQPVTSNYGASSKSSDAEARPPMLTILVTDTGIGVKPDEVEALFSPYAQMKLSTYREHGGTGLGR